MSLSLVVVSGLPRSGTSLMMGALAAGGLPVVSDGKREADRHNPRGYFEDRRVLKLAQDARWLQNCGGKALKILSHQLPYLPPELPAKVLFMRRPINQIMASQSAMLGETGHDPALANLFGRDLVKTLEWLGTQPNLATLEVSYPLVLAQPREEFTRVVEFLGESLNLDAMTASVDPSLHRQKH